MTYVHVQLSPLCVPEAPTAHQIHTDIADHVMETWYAPYACYVIGMKYQVTTTVDTPTIEAGIALALGDRDGAFVSDIAASRATIPDNLAAADTIFEVEIPPAAVTAGDSVVAVLDIAGTGGGPAGAVKVWAVIQPAEM